MVDRLFVHLLEVVVAPHPDGLLKLVAHCWHADASVERPQVELVSRDPLLLVLNQVVFCFRVLLQGLYLFPMKLLNVSGILLEPRLHRFNLMIEQGLLVFHCQCEVLVHLL